MTYTEALNGIHSRKTFSSTATLERIQRLMEALGNPQDQYRTVHVAGTNGKGSVSAMVESALRAAGFRVGLFTSPYLLDFRERIQINRTLVSKHRLIAAYRRVLAVEEKLEAAGWEPINEFELVTALGFTVFAQEHVDYAVIEVGLGGRFDATNVLTHPDVCCITSISLDHTAVLGNTVAEIAGEKAGIIKAGCPVVTGAQSPDALEVIESQAAAKKSPFYHAKPWRVLRMDPTGQMITDGTHQLQIPLIGAYQAENAAIAWSACQVLGLQEKAVQAGFSSVSWPGRMQYLPGPPEMLIDAGHNPAGIDALCKTLDRLFPNRRIIGVISMMRDKDCAGMVPAVASRCRLLITTTVGLPRSMPPEELSALGGNYCPVLTSGSVGQGIRLAEAQWEPGDLVLVCGSVYGAGAALEHI